MSADVEAFRDRILLVDDEPEVLLALEDILADEYKVFTAESAAGALDLIEKERGIAVVVTDQRMPRMTGDELLAKLSGTSDAVRVMITGFADLSAVIRAVNEGRIFAYITKPWNADEFKITVNRAAEHFRLARQLAEERRLLGESERRLRKQTSVLNSILDSMDDAVVVVDANEELLLFNRQARHFLGPPPSVPLSASWTDIFGVHLAQDKKPIPREDGLLRRAMLDAQTVSREVVVSNQLVPERVLSMTATPLRDPDNAVVGSVALLRDITQQRKLEAQLLQSQKMEAIGRFAGGVVHDFNNILSVIQSYAEIVLSAAQQEQEREDVGQIIAASQRATTLTRQLLAFCRRQVIRPELIRIGAVIANIEKMLQRLIGEDIVLSTALTADIGTVRVDPGQLEQIVLNLAVNARDAMPQGGELRIETADAKLEADSAAALGARPGNYAVLTVSDNGSGMDEATQARIFEPFFTTKDDGKGTGLGLSTVYGIVQQANGHIALDSAPGRGTTFRIYFPNVSGDAAARRSLQPPQNPAHGSGTILIVEDNDAVCQVAARILRSAGYRVLPTSKPDEARRLCISRGSEIDLLLLDVVMPRGTGPQLAVELRKYCPRAKLVFMSGYLGATVTSDVSWRAGAGFLQKPFTPATLVERVTEALSASATERASDA